MFAIRGGKLTSCYYWGKKFGLEKNKMFQQADIFVFPTYYSNECFPVVLLEAMQNKLPIVTTDEGGIADIVEDKKNGFVCARNDASAVAERLAVLLKDQSLRKSMGDLGYQKYKASFTIQQFELQIMRCLMQSAEA